MNQTHGDQKRNKAKVPVATSSGQTGLRPQLRAAQGGARLCPLLRTPTHLLEDGASSGGSPWPLRVGRGPRLPPGGPLQPVRCCGRQNRQLRGG